MSATPAETRIRSEKIAIFRLLALVLVPPMEFLARFVIIDGHKLPKTGAFVLSPNHYSEIDPVVIGRVMYKLGRMPRYLTKASLFSVPVMGWFLRTSGQIPVERTGVVRGHDPIAAANTLAHAGHAVVIYPEGSLTRDPDLWPMRGKTGAVRMALLADIPLIPVAHWGTQHVMSRYGRKISLFPRKTITIKIGDPVDLSAFRGKGLDPQTLTAATTVLMTEITKLLADLRGEPIPAEIWDPSKHSQTEIGRFEQP
ncbi:lysophospholipid acyltransferase family protein [Frigoribacterium sp. CG_9.8]|uniref:lysophospholipid acyltransferase family protein n=1 Tax=Frigoribacterium sp. CG_9.8 TaxID=2787733 RepID=UPI001A2EF9E5|nr:1-acyl-sn-glycerol-3-phosphate acyltransferase [Frigoribacterium sp. CG_9.8]